MSETDFAGIAVVGVAISLIQNWINKKWELTTSLNRALTLALSLVIGIAYFVLRSSTWWTTIIGVLASASTFYALALKKPSDVQ